MNIFGRIKKNQQDPLMEFKKFMQKLIDKGEIDRVSISWNNEPEIVIMEKKTPAGNGSKSETEQGAKAV